MKHSDRAFAIPTREQIATLFVTPTAITIETPADLSQQLTEQEAAGTASMGQRRLHDYSTGRACARAALLQLGLQGFSLLNAADRQPIWPTGVCGSISHCDGVALAVVSNDKNCRGLGVDVERVSVLEEDVIKMVCTTAELDWMQRLSSEQRNRVAHQIFSIKESLFKCLFPVFDVWFDFQQASLTLSVEDQRYRVAFDASLPFANAPGQLLTGRFAALSGVVASSAELLHQPC